MSFIQPIPCSDGGGGDASCCPHIITGYCLEDGTPIAISIVNGVQTTWTNLLTGVVTPGPPPVGAGICPAGDIQVVIQPLTCEKDSITICPGDNPIVVTGTVELGAATLAALETVTVNQGTSPWIIGDGGSSITIDAVSLDIRPLDYTIDDVSIAVIKASAVSVPAQTITGAAAIILSANPARKSFTIQNTGTEPVKFTFGASNPTSTAYHFALSAGVVADDGKGAFYVDDQWDGDVRAFSDNPGSIVVTEIF